MTVEIAKDMKDLLSFLLLVIILGSPLSKAQEHKIESTTTRTIRVDPDLANGGAMSQVFSEINFIPLETTKESLFGDITQLEVTDNSYIIFDQDTKSILIFTRQGRFKAKINGTKINDNSKSNENSSGFYGFNLVRKSTGDIIQINIKDKVYSYGTDGKLIEIIKPEAKKMMYDDLYTFNDSVQVVSYFKDKGSSSQAKYGYALLKKNQVVSKYFEIDTGKYSRMGDFAVGGPSFIKTDNPNILHAVKFYDYNIYQITNHGISVAYTLVFPSNNTIPADFNTNPIYFGKKMDYFFKNGRKIYGIGHTYQIGDFLYFKCGSLSPFVRKNGSLVYDLKNDYLLSLNRLDPDTLSHFLPIIGRWENDFKKYDGNYLYASLSSLEMFTYYQQEKNKKIKYPISIANYFEKGSKKDNPVIIQLKPKKSR